jgi:hypothetical protein
VDFKSSAVADVTHDGSDPLARKRRRLSPLQPAGVETDLDLGAIVDAWRTLSMAMRAGIVAMVKAASANEARE